MVIKMYNDLIRRTEAIEVIRSMTISLGGKLIFHQEAKESVINALKDVPSVDAEPVEYSMWQEHLAAQNTRYWTCLNCDTIGSPRWKRCPVCEAKMHMIVGKIPTIP